MRDAALEVERQTLIRQTRRRPYDELSSGNPSQGSSKRVVSTMALRAAEDPVGTDVVPVVVGSREVDTHEALDFDE